jgi:hypothetical protein
VTGGKFRTRRLNPGLVRVGRREALPVAGVRVGTQYKNVLKNFVGSDQGGGRRGSLQSSPVTDPTQGVVRHREIPREVWGRRVKKLYSKLDVAVLAQAR